LVLKELQSYWQEELGVSLQLRHVFSCKRDAEVQSFLIDHFPDMEALVLDAKYLCQPMAPTIHGVSSKMLRLESTDVYIAGFVCKTRCKLNPTRGANVGCVQDNSEKTGESWQHVPGYIHAFAPKLLILENVVELSDAEEGAISDCNLSSIGRQSTTMFAERSAWRPRCTVRTRAATVFIGLAFFMAQKMHVQEREISRLRFWLCAVIVCSLEPRL
jgi:hypothetical protein